MNKSFEYFLSAAEEMNFTKAAKKNYVSQQCISEHIKRLENEYNTILFNRTPELSLTEQGKIFLDTLKTYKVMDKSLKRKIEELTQGDCGSFSFGINSSRARVILPDVLHNYSNRFPNVNIAVTLNDTRLMEKMVLDDKLDMFLGVNTNYNDLLDIKHISYEGIYLIISIDTINSFFKNESRTFIKYSKNGVRPKDLSGMNFILNLSKSTTTSVILSLLNNHKIQFKNTLSISDYDTQFAICRVQNFATFAPTTMLERVMKLNENTPIENFLCAFPIKDCDNQLNVQLVKHKLFDPPKYMVDFSNELEKYIKHYNKITRHSLVL